MIGAIIQARLGSERLPRKVKADIEGISMLRRVIRRVKDSAVDQTTVIIPSTDGELLMDIALEGAGVWYGSTDRDVLGDYYRCARTCRYTQIVRITADCPCVDPEVINMVLSAHEEHTKIPSLYHITSWLDVDGMDTEVFSTATLFYTHNNFYRKADREHVTKRMYKNHRAVSEMILGIDGYPDCKLSVDTQEDLDRVRDVYRDLGEDFGIDELIERFGSVDNGRNGLSGKAFDEGAPRIWTP